MEQKRIINGNNAVIPIGAELLGAYATNAVTDKSAHKKGNQPLSNLESVIDAREYMIDHRL